MRRLSSLKVTPTHPFGFSSNKMSSSLSRSSTYTVLSDCQNGMLHNSLFLSRIYIDSIKSFLHVDVLDHVHFFWYLLLFHLLDLVFS